MFSKSSLAALQALDDSLTQKIASLSGELYDYKNETAPAAISALKSQTEAQLLEQSRSLESKMFNAISLRKQEQDQLQSQAAQSLAQLVREVGAMSGKLNGTSDGLDQLKYQVFDSSKKLGECERGLEKMQCSMSTQDIGGDMKKGLEEVKQKGEELEKTVMDRVRSLVKETVSEWKEEEERRTGKLQQGKI